MVRRGDWRIDQISHNFAVKFEVSIPRSRNREMVCEFCVICQNGGILNTLGEYMDFWDIVNSANGADFATFIS